MTLVVVNLVVIVYLVLKGSYQNNNLFILLHNVDGFVWFILAQRMNLVLHNV